MKKLLSALLFWSMLCLWAGSFNVKDYGAKGDGKTDDTAAIRKAVASAIKASRDAYAPRVVYFPSGRYIVNGEIKLNHISLKGNNAAIVQKDKNAVTFNYTDFWHVTINGLTFSGGKGHIAAINDNLDKSLFFVDRCKFFSSSGTALQTLKGAQSTLFTVSNCEFIRCMSAIDSDCDWTTIRDVWIMNPERKADSASIINRHGYMMVDNLLGVPLCNGLNQRWIDNYAFLTATNCRFGGEGGGYTAVYNFAKYKNPPAIPTTVVLKECEIDCHSSGLRNGGVYCVEVPNLIAIENCRSSFSKGILLRKDLDIKKYFYAEKGDIAFRAVGNVGFNGDLIPAELANAPVHPLPFPAGHLSGDALAKKIREYKVVPTKPGCDINILTMPGVDFVLANRMDGSTFFNKDLLAVINKANPACLMRRLPGKVTDAPFAEVQHVKVDLDKTPYFAIGVRTRSHAQFAVKIIDEADGRMYAYTAQQRDVRGQIVETNIPRTIPDLKGKKTLTFRIYYIGREYFPRRGKKVHGYKYADPGSVLEIYEMGFNAKPKFSKNKK